MIKITYDRDADASYLYLQEPGRKEVKKTYLGNPADINGMINIDFDAEGQIIGIEVMDASKKLPKSILAQASNVTK